MNVSIFRRGNSVKIEIRSALKGGKNVLNSHFTFEPQRQNAYLQTCAPSEDSDQPAHSRSLIKIFSMRTFDSQGCKVSPCGQRRLWLVCTDAQADLCIHWPHISENTLSDWSSQLVLSRCHIVAKTYLEVWRQYLMAFDHIEAVFPSGDP